MATLARFSARYWLFSTLFVLTSITAYTHSPLYGADPTPTPNVSTVPRPDQIFTPTPTPAPIIVIITREAPTANATAIVSGNTPDNVSNDPVAEPGTAQPATGGNGNAPPLGSPAAQAAMSNRQPLTETVATATTPVLALTVATTSTMIWPGAVIQLHFVVSNRGEGTLSAVEIDQVLPPALQYQGGQIDNGGRITVAPAVAQGTDIMMHWPLLAQAATATGTLTVQVKADTPNGIFLDNQAVVQSSEGATVTVLFTLVMPPLALPQFRKDP